MHDADADVLLSTKSPTSTYVNAPIQFNALSSVMIVAVMIPLCQMKQLCVERCRWLLRRGDAVVDCIAMIMRHFLKAKSQK